MANNRVNPPKQLQLPPSVAENKELKKAFDDVTFILFQLWKRTGGGEDIINTIMLEASEAATGLNVKSKLFDIRKQIGSGKPVTIDTTGFTIDTTEQTIDMTEV